MLGTMSKSLKTVAALLLLVAALASGILGPLAHGHAMDGSANPPAIEGDVQPSSSASHAGCHGDEPDDPELPGGKHPGNSGLLCSGSAACCAAVAVLELPFTHHRTRVAPHDYLRPALAGLDPPVGERPPSHV